MNIAKELKRIDSELRKLVFRVKAMRQEISKDAPPQYSPTFDKLYKHGLHACAECDRLIASGKYPGLKLIIKSHYGYSTPCNLCWNMEVDVQPWQPRTFEEQYSGDKIAAARAVIDAIEKDQDVMVECGNIGNTWCKFPAIGCLDYVIRPIPEESGKGHCRHLSNYRWPE